MMTNRFKYAIMALVALVATSCYQGEELDTTVNDDGQQIEFVAQVPNMSIVNTRAVDPDGGGVQQITIFCFDENSLFISTVTATMANSSNSISLNGKFRVTIPDHATTLQLVGNQNLTYFREDNYRGMSEVDVMASLEASAGRMIYWARRTVDELKAHNSDSNPVKLLRNQAKITLNVDSSKSTFVEKGWVVVNSNAFGTVAPYSAENGGFVAPTLATPFVTLPDNGAKLGDFQDVRTNAEEYIFETENSSADPIDFIVKGSQNGGEDLYYRISLIDEQDNHVMIMRNHHYTVNIVGDLYYGQPTFAEALTAPATNNVWVSISDNIAEVQDSEYRLAVDHTSVIVGEEEFHTPNTYYLHYTLEALKGQSLSAAEVSWLDGNNVAMNDFSHSFDSTTGRGTILVTLNQMGNEQKREGTILVKKGRLSRKIKVVTVKKQTFEPAWITTNIYGTGTGENVTMMFTIPEECPAELFPMDVLISVNDLDVRHGSGMVLPVINRGDEGYGEDNGIGYKYVLTVNGTGKQRIYFETTLEKQTADNIDVTIEAKHFVTLSKTATFQSEVNQWILLHNLRTYSAAQPADEVIYYYLVPQKVGAAVDFPTHLGKDIVWNSDHTVASYTPIEVGAADEFLIYSRFLDHNESRNDLDFTFYPVAEENWSSGGRVYGFTKNEGGNEDFGATFHMITNTPKSAEVVRIASNPKGQPSVTGSGVCNGAQYRSAIFELANYHPFHFSATVNGAGTVVSGANEEVDDEVLLSYMPGQAVNIEIDITSFTYTTNNQSGNAVPQDQQVSVDPFGTEFEIYIDAPMLKIDESSELYKSGKLRRDNNKEGRFIYRVEANREDERSGKAALAVDAKAASQEGERKVLQFLTKSIVSAGEIVISSDETKVVYYTKRFKVQNSSLAGTLQYRRASDDAIVAVPEGSFVPFEVEPTYNRIGTVTIHANGGFELRLRSEYKYDWNTDNVKLQFIDETGKTYEKVFTSIGALYSSLGAPIILEPVN